MKILNKETVTLFKVDQMEKYKELGYNLISCGSSRGGTSALGILMSYFNFDMGNRVHPTTHEDMDFVDIVVGRSEKKISELIQERNFQNPNWALKLPHALNVLDVFDENCIRSVFFIVVRNPLSVAKSLIKHDPDYSGEVGDYIKGIKHATNFYDNIKKLEGANSPFVLCEYEKILSRPHEFVEDFISITGVACTEEEKNKAVQLIASPGYKAL